MRKIHVTLEMAIAALTAIVGEYGYNYIPTKSDGGSGCTYGELDEATGFINPVCILGVMFHKMGVSRALVSGDMCFFAIFHHENNPLMDSMEDFGVTFDLDASRFLSGVQAQQDDGDFWGDAVTRNIEAIQREKEIELAQQHAIEVNALNNGPLYAATATLDGLRPMPEPLADWEKELLSR